MKKSRQRIILAFTLLTLLPIYPVTAYTPTVHATQASVANFSFDDIEFPLPGGYVLPKSDNLAATQVIEDPRNLIDIGIGSLDDEVYHAFVELVTHALNHPELLERQKLTDLNGLTEETFAPYLNQDGFVIDVKDFGTKIAAEDIHTILDDILFFDPRFFCYGPYIYYLDSNGFITELHIFPSEAYLGDDPIHASQADYDAMLRKVHAIAQAIMQTSENNWQRIRLAHDYLATYLNYDYVNDIEDHTTNNGYMALMGPERITKCTGYTVANSLILAAMGYSVQNISGYARTSEGTERHAWNQIYLNDAWYAIDVTHDDPTKEDIASANQTETPQPIHIQHFLRGSQAMDASHVSRSLGGYPLAQDDYLIAFEQMGTLVNSDAAFEQLIKDTLLNIDFAGGQPTQIEFYINEPSLGHGETILNRISDFAFELQGETRTFPKGGYHWNIYYEEKHPQKGAYILVLYPE